MRKWSLERQYNLPVQDVPDPYAEQPTSPFDDAFAVSDAGVDVEDAASIASSAKTGYSSLNDDVSEHKASDSARLAPQTLAAPFLRLIPIINRAESV